LEINMKIKLLLKTAAALFMAGMTPIVGYLGLTSLYMGILTVSAIFNVGIMDAAATPGFFMDALAYVVLMVLPAILVSFGHVLLFGVPVLLVGWYFRIIRWWTVLITAFLIAVIPTTLTIASTPAGWSGNKPLWQDLNAVNLGMLIGGSLLMGLCGVGSGLVFWLVWRYWVMPDSPEGRPLTSPSKILDASEPQ
jgi:hypothetical protein